MMAKLGRDVASFKQLSLSCSIYIPCAGSVEGMMTLLEIACGSPVLLLNRV